MKRYFYFMLLDDTESAIDRNFFGYQFDELIKPFEVMELMLKCGATKGCVVIDTKSSMNDDEWEELSYFTPPM